MAGTWLDYGNEDASVKYPSDWSKNDMGGTAALFLAPGKQITDILAEKVTFMSTDVSTFSKIPALAGKTLTLDLVAEVSMEMAAKKHGFKFSKSDLVSITIGGLPAKKATFVSDVAGSKLKTTQIFALKGQKMFMLSYSAADATYSKYEKIFGEMLSSVKFK